MNRAVGIAKDAGWNELGGWRQPQSATAPVTTVTTSFGVPNPLFVLVFSSGMLRHELRVVGGKNLRRGLALWLLPALLYAQAAVTGLSDRGVYADAVTFSVTADPGFDCGAELDGAPITLGTPHQVAEADYHEIAVWATNRTSMAVTNFLVRFNVTSSERNGTETGLPPWTPYPPIPSSSAEMAQAGLRLVVPARFPTGLPIPVVVWVENSQGAAVRVNGNLEFPGHPPIRILRGVGSGFLSAMNTPGQLTYAPALRQLSTSRVIRMEESTWEVVAAGKLQTVAWPENSRIAITGNVTIPAGASITIGAGSVIKLSAGVTISLNGRMLIKGSEEEPVVFCPAAQTQPWGGFYLTNSSSVLEATGTIFTGSGADPNAVPQSHRHEQCLFYLDNHSRLSLTNCAAISLAGQFGHGNDQGQPWSEVTLAHTLVQRCTTGGEWNGCSIRILQSAIIEVPEMTPVFNDGDEDGIYFTTGKYEVRDSLVGWTGDDGIDSGSGGAGTVTVSNTWVEAAYHEGFAWSGGNRVATNQHTVSMNCGQGIECGWSSTENSPLVYVDDCMSTANAVGARFGDNYDWTYNGFIGITNSIVVYNRRDVWGMNWDDWTYRTNAMNVQGNWLTRTNARHPENAIWQPASDGARLARFMSIPADAPVGVGLALWNAQLNPEAATNPIPVRLSHFTTRPVSVDFTLETAEAVVSSGPISFAPGETVKLIPPPAGVAPGQLARLKLGNATNAEITGTAVAWLAGKASSTNAVLVPLGATWRYLDAGTNAGATWREPQFDDSGWKSGAAELGYGDERDGRPETTQLSYGTDSNNKHMTYYFRHDFNVPDPAAYRGLIVRLKRDDGGIVYLNGKEIFRSNMPEGTPDFQTPADGTADDDGTRLFDTNAPASTLEAGRNLLAVEIHQESAASSDISFDLQLEGVVPPRLSASWFGKELLLTWDEPEAMLETATALTGPWAEIGRTSPATADLTGEKRFYRLKAKP